MIPHRMKNILNLILRIGLNPLLQDLTNNPASSGVICLWDYGKIWIYKEFFIKRVIMGLFG